jgi:hypothetical protein
VGTNSTWTSLAIGTWEIDTAKRVDFAPVYAADLEKAEKLDLETHARLEAGMIDSFPQPLILSALHNRHPRSRFALETARPKVTA